jgi:hypothetical protein
LYCSVSLIQNDLVKEKLSLDGRRFDGTEALISRFVEEKYGGYVLDGERYLSSSSQAMKLCKCGS